MQIDSVIHLKSYEQIKLLLRRHAITFLPLIGIFIILLLMPIGVYFLINAIFPTFLTNTITYTLMVLFASIYYLSIYLFFYSYFVTFYLDLWIITNDRLVDIRQVTLFARTIAEIDLYQIQDISSDVSGFFPSLFNYGNVSIQTAGTIPKCILYNVPDPHHIRQVILELSAKDKDYHNK
ncbi:MAG: hypothetical protein UR53_C0001G0060 [Candidatus Magasanikbacteria bacterium GW2011_GWC2_34_16]|uniref:YdbS-like PH domain-containing protein n=2 Tax=Candidatus Magasanikiibacteriota TaxID=1752731 RepID=A0A0G0HRB1_9BACT|nr:MAG: hypothetical protein UR53_C0001G0060 [Candidatus Magasanikbacteria bacterium GW2011_GWC2_34_16]KKQ41130.1 MAG: hypothetical protein US58_C0005G0055 [Candidatus Magasanikbacteria bacterium GW2011_GWA2_37_8]